MHLGTLDDLREASGFGLKRPALPGACVRALFEVHRAPLFLLTFAFELGNISPCFTRSRDALSARDFNAEMGETKTD
jgi:hypothetical protein